ncbi:hypothetical protein F5Y18DRAFT_439813, partial [Xylariaceae sp. FL1019]
MTAFSMPGSSLLPRWTIAYVPRGAESPGWTCASSRREVQKSVESVLKSTRDLGDYRTEAVTLLHLIYVSADRQTWFEELERLQRYPMGDLFGLMDTLIMKFMLCDTAVSKTSLGDQLRDLWPSVDLYNTQLNPVYLWTLSRIRYSLSTNVEQRELASSDIHHWQKRLPRRLWESWNSNEDSSRSNTPRGKSRAVDGDEQQTLRNARKLETDVPIFPGVPDEEDTENTDIRQKPRPKVSFVDDRGGFESHRNHPPSRKVSRIHERRDTKQRPSGQLPPNREQVIKSTITGDNVSTHAGSAIAESGGAPTAGDRRDQAKGSPEIQGRSDTEQNKEVETGHKDDDEEPIPVSRAATWDAIEDEG